MEFWLKLAIKMMIALTLWPVVLGSAVLCGRSNEWWTAALAALVIAFIGWDVVIAIVISLIFDDSADD